MEHVSHQIQILRSEDCLLSTRVSLVEVVDGALGLELLDLLPNYLLRWRPAREGEPFLKVVWSERGEKLDAVVVAVAEVWTP